MFDIDDICNDLYFRDIDSAIKCLIDMKCKLSRYMDKDHTCGLSQDFRSGYEFLDSFLEKVNELMDASEGDLPGLEEFGELTLDERNPSINKEGII